MKELNKDSQIDILGWLNRREKSTKNRLKILRFVKNDKQLVNKINVSSYFVFVMMSIKELVKTVLYGGSNCRFV